MSFPYSNGGLAVPLPAENQECFLEGLKILFRQAGFVPRKLRLDNLPAAVVTHVLLNMYILMQLLPLLKVPLLIGI